MTQQQQQYLKLGQQERRRLYYIGQQIASTNFFGKYPHHYIYSEPGLGKTHTVNEALSQSSNPHIEIGSNPSMFALGLTLAVAAYKHQKEQIIVSIDDCNEVLRTPNNINIMKNVLGENRVYHYQKNLGGLIKQLDEIQQEAIRFWSKNGESGFRVSTENMMFVFTANEKLPTIDTCKTVRCRHLLAITDRVSNHELEMEPLVQWGWISDVILNTDSLKFVSEEMKFIICDYLYQNWFRLRTKSIRTAIKMAELVVRFPNNYLEHWDIQFV